MFVTTLLVLHVAFASTALAAGNVALLAPKGGMVHRRSGQVFVAGMLSMTAIALVIALLRRAHISIVPSMLSFYLVATGWLTLARGRDPRRVDLALTVLALTAAATGFALGAIALHPAAGAKTAPPAIFLVFGAVALLGAALDGWRRLRPIASRGARLARHLWRMGLAMVIATTSFFQGQPQVFPPALQGSWLLMAPALMVVLVLVGWGLRLAVGEGRSLPQPRPSRPRSAVPQG